MASTLSRGPCRVAPRRTGSHHDTVLSVVGDEYEYLGELALGIDGSGVTDHEFVLHNVGDLRPERTRCQLVQDHYETQLERQLDVVIGETTQPLDTRRLSSERASRTWGTSSPTPSALTSKRTQR